MRALLLILALLCSQVGCAQRLTSREFGADSGTPTLQRNGRASVAARSRAEAQLPTSIPEAQGLSGRAPLEGNGPATGIGTGGGDEVESKSRAGAAAPTDATTGSSNSTEFDAPFSYSVGVESPATTRGWLGAGMAVGAGVLAVALWAISRRLGK